MLDIRLIRENPEKINELREARQSGKEVNVQEEIAKQEQEQEKA